ncbi:MAG: methylglyoxal synthase [Aquimonas sp.]|nr:methylglyoxal synthase [Aquimonas sp.]
MRFGLAANRRHHEGPDAALFRWLKRSGDSIRALQLGLHAVGRTFDVIESRRALLDHPGLLRYPMGRDGGLMKLVSGVAGGTEIAPSLDGAIYLMDAVDPSSIYPEAQALKRQCVTHGKPFVSTLAGAIEWIEVECVLAGLAPSTQADPLFALESQTVALIAHDARKQTMLDFAAQHFDLLSRFARRIATGTTGGQLNQLAASRGWPAGSDWVDRYQSGPLGGDAQIAELVLADRCQRVVFFEDPHVARQHEADIQLLERAVRVAGDRATCMTSPEVAESWCEAVRRRSV